MTGKSKIAFIRLGSFSHINDSVEVQLAHRFQDKHLHVVDVASGFYKPRLNALMNRLRVWLRHGPDLLSGRREYWDCAYHTPSVFHACRRWIGRTLAPMHGDLAFTFQTQSLFNGAMQGVPHIVYTDHTHLATLSYPGFDRHHLFGDDWISLEKGIYSSAIMCLTMSRYVERSLINDYGCQDSKVVRVLAGGNTPSEASEPDVGRYNRKQILFIGTDWQRKGGPELLSAFQRILPAHPDARLVVIGCSPALNVPSCTVLGMLPLDQVAQYYRESSIFCLPTKNEPFGISVVEAMQNGLPVVTTCIGAMTDMIHHGENGYLVEPGAPEALADALDQLLSSPELCSRMGSNGRKLARTDYNWDAAGRRIEEAIKRVL